MKLYHLIRKDKVRYDEYDSMIVRATSDSAARQIANRHCGDEGEMWTCIKRVNCHLLYVTGKAEMILGSFNAG